MVIDSYDCRLLVLRYRLDVLSQNTQVLAEAVGYFVRICSLLQKCYCIHPEPQLRRLFVLFLTVINALPASLLQLGVDEYLSLTLLAFKEINAKCAFESVVLMEGDQSAVFEARSRPYQLLLVLF